jgi:hypothetical protein
MDEIIKSNMTAEETLNIARQAIRKITDPLQQGERAIIKDLIDKVVSETGIQISIANGIVPMIIQEFVKNGEGTVERGRKGGWFPKGRIKIIDKRERCKDCNQVIRQIGSK